MADQLCGSYHRLYPVHLNGHHHHRGNSRSLLNPSFSLSVHQVCDRQHTAVTHAGPSGRTLFAQNDQTLRISSHLHCGNWHTGCHNSAGEYQCPNGNSHRILVLHLQVAPGSVAATQSPGMCAPRVARCDRPGRAHRCAYPVAGNLSDCDQTGIPASWKANGRRHNPAPFAIGVRLQRHGSQRSWSLR